MRERRREGERESGRVGEWEWRLWFNSTLLPFPFPCPFFFFFFLVLPHVHPSLTSLTSLPLRLPMSIIR